MVNGGVGKMNGSTAIDYRNPIVIRKLGIDVLTRELGPVGMAYFIRQYDKGDGNYTKERHAWLDDLTTDDILRDLKEMEDRK
jgi:hypothetical protein